MALKDDLKQRRIELNLTMADVADKVGVSEATISRWESGDITNMRRDKIALLAKVLKVSPLKFLYPDPDDTELIEKEKKHPFNETIPIQFRALETLLPLCGFELTLYNKEYAIFYDDGFITITEEDLEKLQDDVLNYFDYNIKKYILSQINNENICVDIFPELNKK